MRNPEHKHAPLWRKSMLSALNIDSILEFLYEIMDNGDMHGYQYGDESAYYLEYKELFDELSLGADELWDVLQHYDLRDKWDDMTVALLGSTSKILGYDVVREDYYTMLGRWDEELAVEEAEKRLSRLTKRELIRYYGKVLTTLLLFFDIKCAHDCLCAIVEELDFRSAIMKNGSVPQKAWTE